MFAQSWICPVLFKNNSTKFLTLSKIFANLDFKVYSNLLFVNITLPMEIVINITLSKSSITILCFNYIPQKHSSKKGALAV